MRASCHQPPRQRAAHGLCAQVLAHVVCGPGSTPAAQYAAVASLHSLMRFQQNRAALLGQLVEYLGSGDWEAAGRAAGVLWELCHDEATGTNFLVLQVR